MVGISKSFYMCGAVDLVVLSLFVMYQLRLSLISRPIKAELAAKKRNRLGFFKIKDVNAEKADIILKQKQKEKKEKEVQKQKEVEKAKAKKIAKEKEIAKKAKESSLEAKKVKDKQKKDADNAAAMKAKKEADIAAAAALKAKTVPSSSKPKSTKKK